MAVILILLVVACIVASFAFGYVLADDRDRRQNYMAKINDGRF